MCGPAFSVEEEKMTGMFVSIYRFFRKHSVLMYFLLGLSVILMGLSLVRLKFDENIMSFLPETGDARQMTEVFNNLKVSDRFVVMFGQTCGEPDYDLLGEAADAFVSAVLSGDGADLVSDTVVSVDDEAVSHAAGFIFDHLPVFLDEKAYSRLDSLMTPSAMERQMEDIRDALLSPAGAFIKDYVMRDPLGIAVPVLSSLSDMDTDGGYRMAGDRILSPDGNTLLCFLTPRFGTGETGHNDRLVSIVEDAIESLSVQYPSVTAEYFAGPAVGVYNARQIKKDTFMTSAFAVVLIAVFVFLAFRRRGSVLLIFLPVVYGILFSLSAVSLLKGCISAIAVGTGAVVLGIALSYSIHVIVHQMHVRTVEQLVRELAFPLTVGSMTTIGAFVGLLFTSSSLLKDFGLFASLALVGTTLFTLVFLPHFLRPMSDVPETPIMKGIGKINGYGYDRNMWVIAVIVLLFIVSLFTSRNVGFNADMMSINYMPEYLRVAQEKLETMSGDSSETVLFVSTGKDLPSAVSVYAETGNMLDSLLTAGLIRHFSSAERFVVPYDVQRERVEVWNSYWTVDRIRAVTELVGREAADAGFRTGVFSKGLEDMLSREYGIMDYSAESVPPLLSDMVCCSDSLVMLVSAVSLGPEMKAGVYPFFNGTGTVIYDRSWFAGSAVRSMSEDLDLILWISSMIVFLGLWLSYRRLELALLSFLPMLVTWVMIVGLMGLTGMEFNIVNIVISTFIFGIGDDFSIFITDGLSRRYATGKDMLAAHRTAIFFSAFTIVAGMGAMIAAGHPALHSVGAISLVGMLAVLLVAYTLQPLLFRLFVTGPVSEGGHPYTIAGILMSALLWLEFLAACLVTILAVLVLLPVPVSRFRKQVIVRYMACIGCRCVLFTAPIAKARLRNVCGEDFSRPAVVVGNHQSFLDIVWMMALNPKLLIVAKGWVRKVPVFYPVARFLGFYYTDSGYDSITEEFGKRLGEGWSLAVFPEGTRETDGKIHRFHKGAFYIAERLGIDIVPVVMYGNGLIFPKNAPLNMAEGVSVTEILPRVQTGTVPYRELARNVRELIRERYSAIGQEFATVSNPYYSWALRRSMMYRGTEAERSTKAMLRCTDMAALDAGLPRNGRILHLGCGMGQADILLKMLAPGRMITAVDTDAENMDMARHNYLCTQGLEFICADPDTFPAEGYDAVIYGSCPVSFGSGGNSGTPFPGQPSSCHSRYTK